MNKLFLRQINRWFTLVELVMVLVLLWIISTISIITFNNFSSNNNDSVRLSDISEIKSAFKLFHQHRWIYPTPANSFEITNNWTWYVIQGKLTEDVSVSTLDNISTDPKTLNPYVFSILKTKQAYQISTTLENENDPIAVVDWNWYTVSEELFPSLVFAYSGSSSIEIHPWVWDDDRAKFIINLSRLNLPYSLETWEPINRANNYTEAVFTNDVKFLRDSDYRNCQEIHDAYKFLWNWNYDVIEELWWNFVKVYCECVDKKCITDSVFKPGNVTWFAWWENIWNIDMWYLSITWTTFSGYARWENSGWIDFNNWELWSNLSIVDWMPWIRKFSGKTYWQYTWCINFETDSTNRVTIDSLGYFRWKAWSENMWWINFEWMWVRVFQ